MGQQKEQALDKQDAAEVKNFTRTPNMLIFGYHDILSPQEKWLYVCLKHLCGKKGTRHLSLRYISEQTGISTGALSTSKNKKGEVNLGMLRHLHDAGLIHSEIKKPGKGNPQYHITITDVWGLNQAFFTKCSDFGQDEEDSYEPVRISDEPVQISDRSVQISDEPVRISANTKITDKTNNKITEQERENASALAPTRAPAVSLEQESETRTNGDERPVNDSSDSAVPASGDSLRRLPRDTSTAERDTGRTSTHAAVRAASSQTSETASEGATANGQLSEQTSPALSQDGAARTSQSSPRASDGRKPREKPPVKPTQPAKEPEPSFALTDEQMAFWKLWCGVWFNTDIPPRLNETAYGHVRVLAPHITTEAQLNSLIKHTRKDLQESQGIKRKTVQLGNLVHCYSGWKQAQIKDEPASNGLPPSMTREQRKAMPVW